MPFNTFIAKTIRCFSYQQNLPFVLSSKCIVYIDSPHTGRFTHSISMLFCCPIRFYKCVIWNDYWAPHQTHVRQGRATAHIFIPLRWHLGRDLLFAFVEFYFCAVSPNGSIFCLMKFSEINRNNIYVALDGHLIGRTLFI